MKIRTFFILSWKKTDFSFSPDCSCQLSVSLQSLGCQRREEECGSFSCLNPSVFQVMPAQPPLLPRGTTLLTGALVALGVQEHRPALSLLPFLLSSLHQSRNWRHNSHWIRCVSLKNFIRAYLKSSRSAPGSAPRPPVPLVWTQSWLSAASSDI